MEFFSKRKTEPTVCLKKEIKHLGELDTSSFIELHTSKDFNSMNLLKKETTVTFQYNYGRQQKGILKITACYMRIVSLADQCLFDPIHIFLGDIDNIKCISLSKPSASPDLIDCKIDCKTFQRIHLYQVNATTVDFLKERSFFKAQLRRYPAFHLKRSLSTVSLNLPPWKTSYFGDLPEEREALEKSNWRIDITTNSLYQLCDTYPHKMVVPATSTEQLLTLASSHRTRGRIPILSWLSKDNYAAICRSSQPRTGLTNKRSSEDETVLNNILTTSITDLPVDGKLIIFDARPRLNATVCHATGGGVENVSSKYSYCGIENIHEVRKSHQRLRKLCLDFHKNNQPIEVFLRETEKTGWLKHIKTILKSSVKAAQCVSAGSTVLIHCSDGWDRTAQLTSLMIILLDPTFRTIQGFMRLIEREWCSMGHRFATRLGQGTRQMGEDARAPIFLQFVECVWRLQQRYTRLFEFNEDFLITLLLHSYSCCFGNFLFDSEKERVDHRVFESTFSLWDYLASHETRFKNPFYNPSGDETFQLNSTPPMWHAHPPPFWQRWYLFYQRNYEMTLGTLPELDRELGLL